MKQHMVRIPEELYREIERQAKSEQRSINQMTNLLLWRTVGTQGKYFSPKPDTDTYHEHGGEARFAPDFPRVKHIDGKDVVPLCKTHGLPVVSGYKCLQKDCRG